MKAKDTEDMSMDEILASIRQYVSSTNDGPAAKPAEKVMQMHPMSEMLPQEDDEDEDMMDMCDMEEEDEECEMEEEQSCAMNVTPMPQLRTSTAAAVKSPLESISKLKEIKEKKKAEALNPTCMTIDEFFAPIIEKMFMQNGQELNKMIMERMDKIIEKIAREKIDELLKD